MPLIARIALLTAAIAPAVLASIRFAEGGTITASASFNGVNGTTPDAHLYLDNSGNLYGTTASGGASGRGAIFEYTPGGSINTLASFDLVTNGTQPQSALVPDGRGDLIGTTVQGGPGGGGTLYEYSAGSGISVLANFSLFSVASGSYPVGNIVLDSQGDIFGTTRMGGSANLGTIFEYSPGVGLTTLASFTGPNGAQPVAGLTRDASGNLYGTTLAGGTGNQGTLFQYTPGVGLTTLASFTGVNGASPSSPVVLDARGNLYGSAYSGGSYGYGSLFEYTPGVGLMTLASFGGPSNGANPQGALVLDDSGILYGTTTNGGSPSNDGTMFSYQPGVGLSTQIGFTGTNGAHPTGGLITNGQGYYFGTTFSGGTGEYNGTSGVTGLVFAAPPSTGPPRSSCSRGD